MSPLIRRVRHRRTSDAEAGAEVAVNRPPAHSPAAKSVMLDDFVRDQCAIRGPSRLQRRASISG